MKFDYFSFKFFNNKILKNLIKKKNEIRLFGFIFIVHLFML